MKIPVVQNVTKLYAEKSLGTNMIDTTEHIGLVHRSCWALGITRSIEDSIEFAEGCLGLHKAAQNFDPELGFQFSTYATYKIRGHIKQCWRKKSLPTVSCEISDFAENSNRNIEEVDNKDFIECLLKVVSANTKYGAEIVRGILAGKTQKTIASELGIDKSTAIRAMHQIRRITQRMIQ